MEEELKKTIEDALRDRNVDDLRKEIKRLEQEREELGRAIIGRTTDDDLVYLRTEQHEDQEKIRKLNKTIELVELLGQKEEIDKQVETYKNEFGLDEEGIGYNVEQLENEIISLDDRRVKLSMMLSDRSRDDHDELQKEYQDVNKRYGLLKPIKDRETINQKINSLSKEIGIDLDAIEETLEYKQVPEPEPEQEPEPELEPEQEPEPEQEQEQEPEPEQEQEQEPEPEQEQEPEPEQEQEQEQEPEQEPEPELEPEPKLDPTQKLVRNPQHKSGDKNPVNQFKAKKDGLIQEVEEMFREKLDIYSDGNGEIQFDGEGKGHEQISDIQKGLINERELMEVTLSQARNLEELENLAKQYKIGDYKPKAEKEQSAFETLNADPMKGKTTALVNKSKFAQIFEGAKGKIKGVWDKLKATFRGKENDKSQDHTKSGGER